MPGSAAGAPGLRRSLSNLLLLNRFPDVEADRTVGRKRLPIAIGRKGSACIVVAATLP